ncbi:hypothetical protein [Flavobacterium sp. LB2P6]|uniref:hypothetical protein n=1 Tax=Flavobacterium sp. LB2P6 TaxID=3401714 RepID=UPI003AACA589
MNEHKKGVVILTACISPQNINLKSFRSDPEIRLNDYLISLKRWLYLKCDYLDAIIFVENSNTDLSRLKELVLNDNLYNRKIEFLSFQESPRPEGVNYGYSEMEIIDFAFDQSKLLPKYDFFIKATGRLFFTNLSRLLKYNAKNNYDFIGDCRDFKFFNKEQHYLNTTLFITKNEFYKINLYNMKNALLDGSLMENLYFEILKNKKNVKNRFPFNVDRIGYGAHSNVNYNSLSRLLNSKFRSVIRVLFPNFKI